MLLDEQIGQLVQAVPAAPVSRFVSSASYASTMMLEAGCSQLSVQQCHVADETPAGRCRATRSSPARTSSVIPSRRLASTRWSRRSSTARPTRGSVPVVCRLTCSAVRSTTSPPTRPRGLIAVRCSTRSTPRPGGTLPQRPARAQPALAGEDPRQRPRLRLRRGLPELRRRLVARPAEGLLRRQPRQADRGPAYL